MKWSQFFLSIITSAIVAAGVTYGMLHRGVAIGLASTVRGSDPSGVVDTPGLVGLKPEQARALLEARGLLLVLDQEQPDTHVEPGKICRQEPLEGSRLRRGETVRAALARAPDLVPVPSVVGRSASKAKELLSQAGFTPGEVRYQSNLDRTEGIVLEQSPASGNQLSKGAKIDLIVNRFD
jgi:serine/threonine-protein kinase